MMRGLNVMYDMVRRPSQMVTSFGMMQGAPTAQAAAVSESIPGTISPIAITPIPTPHGTHPASLASTMSRGVAASPACESPQTLPEIEIDDEFNLPISLAISILVFYMLSGAVVYNIWEKWGFLNAVYFVFISMSTIGFGDYVPQHPIYMMASIIYLVFGLALTSMCINVVQIKLSDTFRIASAKLGATIGLQQMADSASAISDPHSPVELAGVHVHAATAAATTIMKDDDITNTVEAPKMATAAAATTTTNDHNKKHKNQFEFPVANDVEGGDKNKKKSDKNNKKK